MCVAPLVAHVVVSLGGSGAAVMRCSKHSALVSSLVWDGSSYEDLELVRVRRRAELLTLESGPPNDATSAHAIPTRRRPSLADRDAPQRRLDRTPCRGRTPGASGRRELRLVRNREGSQSSLQCPPIDSVESGVS